MDFDLDVEDIDNLEKDVYDGAVLITALVNSRKEEITPKMALILSTWIELKTTTDNLGRVGLYVSLINGGQTDDRIRVFLKSVLRNGIDRLSNHFKRQ